jgi:hypothetical protein
MRVSSLRICAPLLAVLLLSAVQEAAAEPVTLTSGGIFYSRQNQAEFQAMSLSGIEIRGQFGDEASESWDPDHACFGCTPGARISLSQSESFTNDSGSVGAGGSVRLDGVDYWFDSMSFRINAGHIDIPDTSDFGGATMDAGRFVFHGMITGTSDAGVTQTFRVHGKGTVSIFFGNNDWFSTNYKFADASAAAVPEPGTMLLFGSGAVAALVRRRSQQRQR